MKKTAPQCCLNIALSSHFPFAKRNKKIQPRKQSSTAIAIQTPCNPITPANTNDNVIRTPQILIKFIIPGTKVSPAPRNAPDATIEARAM